ncbi:MAG: neutral/alkaline non-lysosomal ceramidase N-terminal domain-containing protein [Bacteroidetes bacterium]|nr:neutral/alkaline non-lysosomal ceramidase N-terminal domain-containing protein [Bacteroidota bacterium]
MIKAGASEIVVTPETSQFLFGYPHVERYSTGVYDELYSAALYLDDGNTQIMFISNDLIFVDKQMSAEIRNEISQKTGIPKRNIMVTATHTHSGPIMTNYASSLNDPIVPKADVDYLAFSKEKIISVAVSAYNNADEAVLGMTKADSTGIGTNRRDPAGPSDHEVPVLAVMDKDRSKYIACMMVGTMHPTVLHEDSTLLSGDFPGLAKQYLKKNVMGEDCVMLYHSGPCGNQSPRHVVTATTFAEAERLGAILGKAVEKAAASVVFPENPTFAAENLFVPDLERKTFPTAEEAEKKLNKLLVKMDQMVEANAPHPEIRTLECDIFGAEETVTLSELSENGELDKYYDLSLPAEIQLLVVGPWKFIGWSGEIFVEYGLAIKKQFENTFVITMANGEFQGYIVTPEAAEEGGYEASNSLFTPEAGNMLVRGTEKVLESIS